jgi:methylmalonyl-CoA/ethylmalonyl-CoA epimerase
MSERVLDHVGVAVPDLEAAIPVWEALIGAPATDRERVESQGVEAVFLGQGAGRVELVAPFRADSPVTRFLDRRGTGMHHLCYRVPDIRAAMQEYRQAGFQPIDEEPRVGAHGHLVAFLHPRSATGVLIELLEARPG